ncbi:MAG: RpiB/LacA/LacB family sugar-phosphate isomerase [Candidatus Electrothrix sp. AUS1_2]|nr:RpiB/LacA/LacB family sugar-phosphate isomerase [Candidatus Electrothrix sp. AUS1_2]
MRIAVGADAYGLPLKDAVKKYLDEAGYEVKDFGVVDGSDATPYYQTADEVASSVANGDFDRGILVCGTGMGMAIIANKHPGVYAAVCESTFAAEKSRSINNANILKLGAMVTAEVLAREIAEVWLKTEFTQGWDAPLQEWLRNSMAEILSIEQQRFL